MYKMVGATPPAGLDLKDIGKSTTDKAKVIATLKDSYAHAKKAITAMPDADLEKSMDWFAGKLTERAFCSSSYGTELNILGSRSPTPVK